MKRILLNFDEISELPIAINSVVNDAWLIRIIEDAKRIQLRISVTRDFVGEHLWTSIWSTAF